MTDRKIRFSESFFEQLEELLPSERGTDGTPSITDFLVMEVPGLRDGLAGDAIRLTQPTGLEGVRMYINAGTLVPGIVMYMLIDEHSVEVFAVSFDIG